MDTLSDLLKNSQTAFPAPATGAQVRGLTDNVQPVTPKSLADAMAFTTPPWAASFKPDWSTYGFNQSIVATGATTYGGPFLGGKDGEPFVIEQLQDATGGRTASFDTTYFKILPTLTITASTAANARDQFGGILRNRSGVIVAEVSWFNKGMP